RLRRRDQGGPGAALERGGAEGRPRRPRQVHEAGPLQDRHVAGHRDHHVPASRHGEPPQGQVPERAQTRHAHRVARLSAHRLDPREVRADGPRGQGPDQRRDDHAHLPVRGAGQGGGAMERANARRGEQATGNAATEAAAHARFRKRPTGRQGGGARGREAARRPDHLPPLGPARRVQRPGGGVAHRGRDGKRQGEIRLERDSWRMKLSLRFKSGTLEVELLDTPTTRALLAVLPFEARAQTWGEEVYFATPVKAKLEKDARQVVEPGTVCFWTEGDAIALPYGRTPISTDERPKLASRCNVLGKIVGDPKRLGTVQGRGTLTVERV